MKLTIAANHSWPHTGGTETVIQEIAEAMANRFGHDVTIISRTAPGNGATHNGVSFVPCGGDAKKFFEQVAKLQTDRLFVYSDCFRYWLDLLDIAPLLPNNARCSIAPVGMNKLLSRRMLFSKFRKKHIYFQTITHSDTYQDYTNCRDAGIPVHVVPNGISLKTFVPSGDSFREKYNIKTKHMILCVSNFFPGKGQERLLPVLNRLHREVNDVTTVFICTTVNFYVANNMMNQFRQIIKKVNFKAELLRDIPREDVVDAFHEADAFVFPSQVEVAPLVVLEAMAAELPWVALPVGNVPSLAGGFMVPYKAKDSKGWCVYCPETEDMLVHHLKALMLDEQLRKETGQQGRAMIEDSLTWDKITPRYNELFMVGQEDDNSAS